jgi:hypothetical protein
MIVTLSVKAKIHPPLTEDRALRLASRYFRRCKVKVSGGSKQFWVAPTKVLEWIPGRGRGLMTVMLSIQDTIAAREKLTEYQMERLVGKYMPLEDVIRIEGGQHTYLYVVEDDGMRSIYPLGECRACGKDTLGSGDYCQRCTRMVLEESDWYYSLGACADLVEDATEEVRLAAETGDIPAANELAELAETLGIDNGEFVRMYWESERKKPAIKSDRTHTLEVGDSFYLRFHQGWRDAKVLARIGSTVLVEYVMRENVSTLKTMDRYSIQKLPWYLGSDQRTSRNVSYRTLPKMWLRALIEQTNFWLGVPQRTKELIPAPLDMWIGRYGDTAIPTPPQ